MWYRGLALESERSGMCSDVQQVLQLFGAARMVVGHTIVGGRYKTRCAGTVHLIDVGMSAAYGNVSAAWRCVGGVVTDHSSTGGVVVV